MPEFDFETTNDDLIAEFGETDPATLWPGKIDHTLVFGIFTKASMSEDRAPGSVARFFIKSSVVLSLPREIQLKEEIQIAATVYVITKIDTEDDGGGGTILLLRQ